MRIATLLAGCGFASDSQSVHAHGAGAGPSGPPRAAAPGPAISEERRCRWGAVEWLSPKLPGFARWELSEPVQPRPSLLYALTPCGLGTPYVESLASYVTRLAEAHVVSVWRLILQIRVCFPTRPGSALQLTLRIPGKRARKRLGSSSPEHRGSDRQERPSSAHPVSPGWMHFSPGYLSNEGGLVLGLFEGLARNRRAGIRPFALGTSRSQGLSRPLLAFERSVPTLPIAIRNPESESAPRLLLNVLAAAGDLRLARSQRVDG